MLKLHENHTIMIYKIRNRKFLLWILFSFTFLLFILKKKKKRKDERYVKSQKEQALFHLSMYYSSHKIIIIEPSKVLNSARYHSL